MESNAPTTKARVSRNDGAVKDTNKMANPVKLSEMPAARHMAMELSFILTVVVLAAAAAVAFDSCFRGRARTTHDTA